MKSSMVSARALFLGLTAVGAAMPVPARSSPATSDSQAVRRSIRAARLVGSIELDGRPDEPAWQAAETGGAFTQTEPKEGQPASGSTRFWVLWDEDSLYVAAECIAPDGVTAVLSRRDRASEGDKIEFNLDTTLDRRTAYLFTVFAAGHQLDGLRFNDTEMTTDWDAAWESGVVRTPSGWSFEARIPLRMMHIPKGAREFGFNMSRTISRRSEQSRWQFVPRGVPGEVSSLGRLTGMDGIRSVRTIEIRPYLGMRTTLARPVASDQGAPLLLGACSSTGITGNVFAATCTGIDARIGLTSSLALVGTLNPDFGHVEADKRVLNLSTFETFFPEKRPFFVQGMEAFQPPYNVSYSGLYGGNAYQLFYSRRIGRSPPAAHVGAGQRLVYSPTARPVNAALKLSGSIGAATVGLLSAYEPRVNAVIEDADGELSTQPLADAIHSGVGRASLPLGDHLIVGTTMTAVDPLFARAPETPNGAAPDPRWAANGRHSYAGAFDLALFDEDRNWNLRSQVAGSTIWGGRTAVLRDGTLLGDGSSGLAASAKLSKENGAVTAMLDADYLSPGFWVDDLGFMSRANLFRTLGLVTLRDLQPGSRWHRAHVSVGGRLAQDANRDVILTRDGFVSARVLLSSYWEIASALIGGPRAADDRELLDGTPFERLGVVGGIVVLASDRRKQVSGSLALTHQEAVGRDSRFTDAVLNVLLRPAPALDVDASVNLSLTENVLRMIRAAGPPVPDPSNLDATLDPATAMTMERQYLFAPLDARSVGLTLRGTLALNPGLTLEAYGQLFTAGTSYRDPLRAVVGPGKTLIRQDQLTPAMPADLAPNNDGQQGAININLILRWEWRLGSTLYVVYAHETANDLVPSTRGLDFGSELGAVIAGGASHGDTLLVKIDFLQAL
jgi:Domain of unknown function (DUF5916)/Carbohydrate family 9 binding domain-like